MYWTAFDIAEAVPSGAIFFALAGLLPTAVGFGLLRIARGRSRSSFFSDAKVSMPVAVTWLAFAILWMLLATVSLIVSWTANRSAVESGECDVVEGVVEEFVPMAPSGPPRESFTVDGVRFSYSKFLVSTGFNQTQLEGGPMRGGLQVRICSRPEKSGRTILKLEIQE